MYDYLWLYSLSHLFSGLDFESTSDVKLDLSTHLVLEHPLVLKSHWKKEALTFDSSFEAEYGTEKLQYHAYANEDHAGEEYKRFFLNRFKAGDSFILHLF